MNSLGEIILKLEFIGFWLGAGNSRLNEACDMNKGYMID